MFHTVEFRAIYFGECPEGTDFLTCKMIKNIKLPETFRHEYSISASYHFFEIDKMICL